MTGRERLIKVLNGEQVDRIPNAPFIFYNVIDEYFGKEKAESMDSERHDLFYIKKGIELYERFSFDCPTEPSAWYPKSADTSLKHIVV